MSKTPDPKYESLNDTPTPPNIEREELRANIVHSLGLCRYGCDGINHVEATDAEERADIAKVMAAIDTYVEQAVKEASIKLLLDFQPGKHTDPEHLATLMQEEICRLSATPHQKEEGGE